MQLPADDTTVIKFWKEQGLNNEPISGKLFSSYRKAIVFGAAPNLPEFDIHQMEELRDEILLVTADGATRWILEQDIFPDLVITDLDGLSDNNLEGIFKNNIPIQILTHGDNKAKMMHLMDRFNLDDVKELYFSTQGEPAYGWQNTLGFTDGDRAVCLIAPYIDHIYLWGFNLQADFIGKYSKPHFTNDQPMTRSKKIKLAIAEQVLDWVNHHHTIYTKNNKFSPGIELSVEDFAHCL